MGGGGGTGRVIQDVGSGTVGVNKCGKWDFHFNVGLDILVEIIYVSHTKMASLANTK